MNHPRNTTTIAAFTAAAILASLPATATLLVYEPFDYPDGPLNGNGGALGTLGEWVTNDTGFAEGWWCHPEGEVSGAWTSSHPVAPSANTFDGTVDNLPTSGGFVGMPGPADKGATPGERSPTGNLDANIGLDPAVTATFQSGATTWFSFVGVRADDRNEGMPTLMFCTDPTTNGSRGLALQNSGNGICAGGGPPRFNLLSIYPSYFSGGTRYQAPGGYLGGALGGHDGVVTAFCSTGTCDGVLGPEQKIAMAETNPDGSFGAPTIVIGKIVWDGDTGGEDIVSVVAFRETDELTEEAFNLLIEEKPDLSTVNWSDNKPDLDQSAFDTLNIASLKFFVDEIRVATTFQDAITGGVAPPRPFALTVTASGENLDFEWPSKNGSFYNLYSSTDLTVPQESWTLVEGTIPGTPDTNTKSILQPETTTFYYLEEFVPPPLFEEDFEGGDGGFTVVTDAGSDWEFGDPDSSGLGGDILEGNGGSTNCWGTDIGNPGEYAVPTTTKLRSPVIDLTGVAGAELTFAEALDLELNDSAVVNIIEEASDTVIAAAIYTAADGDINSAAWGGVPAINLAAGVGMKVRLEWVFTGGTLEYLGWYIDDVIVTQAAP